MKKIILISSITFLILLLGAYVAMASSVGPNSPGTMADDSAVGNSLWGTPNNAKVSDNIYTSDYAGSGSPSHYLKATNFGFSIPTGATIDGVVVEVEKYGTGVTPPFDYVVDNIVKLTKAGVVSGNDKADTTTHWSSSESYVSYGANNDLWGLSLSPTDINNSGFGMVISASMIANDTDSSANIDHIRITVYYTEAAPASQTRVANVIIFE